MSRQGVVLFVVAAFAGQAWAACPSNPKDLFESNPALAVVYECGGDAESKLCDQPIRPSCKRVSVDHGLKLLNSVKGSTPQKKVLAAYMAAMHLADPALVRSQLTIQTGKYAQVTASLQALTSKCMTAIVQAAYKLHVVFPDYNFVINSQIQNCQNLRDGIKHMLADRKRVRRNLDRFHTPLHSVYLSNHSGFNRTELGKMGLHINVDQAGEIRRLLIDPLKVSQI